LMLTLVPTREHVTVYQLFEATLVADLTDT
jgi:hypothetical protein